MHYLAATDTLAGLSLHYNVAPAELRAHNRLFADTDLAGRPFLRIPRGTYAGAGLRPAPDAGAARKAAVKRFQLATKCVDAEMARVYVAAADGRVDEAAAAWRRDEAWVREQEQREQRGRDAVGRGKKAQ